MKKMHLNKIKARS